MTDLPSMPLRAGAVKVAVRPEAWRVVPEGEGELAGTVLKSAYLGGFHEYTFETALGPVFVVSHELDRVWRPGDRVGLRVGRHGVSVVEA
jgi:iron(III) transport system ATP-binding protein